MTRTNRSMSEPPVIPPDDLPAQGLDDLGGMAMLTACLMAGAVVVVMIVVAWAHHHTTQGRIDRLQADLRALNTFTSCDAPAKPGDTLVVTIRRTEQLLAFRCQQITNPKQPERAFQ